MRTRFAWWSVLAALAVPLGAMGVSTASASAATATECTGNSGTIKLSPGLSETPQVQNISIKGTLSGCSGEEGFTGASYNAHLKTADAVSCSVLTEAGAAEVETNINIKWSGVSSGTFSMPLTEVPVSLGGTLTSGPFSGESIAGTVSQTFTGGATCGVSTAGKKKPKKAKKVNKGSFTGSAVTIS